MRRRLRNVAFCAETGARIGSCSDPRDEPGCRHPMRMAPPFQPELQSAACVYRYHVALASRLRNADFGRPINDARAGRPHKEIVRCDVADADDVADLCYSRFFELASDTRALFPSDMKRQRLRLMDTIAALVGSLDQRELFESLVTVFRPPARQIWRSIALCRNGRSVDVGS